MKLVQVVVVGALVVVMAPACSDDPTQVGGSAQSGGSTAGMADSTGAGTMNGTASTAVGTGSADGASTMGPGTNPGSSDGGTTANGTTDGGSTDAETTVAVSEGSSTGPGDCQALPDCMDCFACEAMSDCVADVDACMLDSECQDALMCLLMCDPGDEKCTEPCGDAADPVEDCLETQCPGCGS